MSGDTRQRLCRGILAAVNYSLDASNLQEESYVISNPLSVSRLIAKGSPETGSLQAFVQPLGQDRPPCLSARP
jgi:hypothetical protein